MNLYSRKQKWKIVLFICAFGIAASSILYTNFLVGKIKEDERLRISIWSEAVKNSVNQIYLANKLFDKIRAEEEKKVRLIAKAFEQLSKENTDYLFVMEDIIKDNTTVPIILSDRNERVTSASNIDIDTLYFTNAAKQITTNKNRWQRVTDSLMRDSLQHMAGTWKVAHAPIPITFLGSVTNFVFYTESKLYAELQNKKDSLVQSFNTELIRNTALVPVIFKDDKSGKIIATNLDTNAYPKVNLDERIQNMESENTPIQVRINERSTGIIYYENSSVLTQIKYLPYIQFTIIGIFLFVAYLIFSTFRNAEQNQVWAGMAKETAHQLGTPISSLMAWNEILRSQQVDASVTDEINKDIERLNTITNRFSKIGSTPILESHSLHQIIENSIDYLKKRVSSQVKFTLATNDPSVHAHLNSDLFEWVLENICRNAVDAMEAKGEISFSYQQQGEQVLLDITDTGKGMSSRQFKTIFMPGFTTKARGWGLGLSLVKRIIHEYHQGKIFVLKSEPGKGTTFRIILNAD
ncbi:MAG: sensor histidine kinase [Flavobacteriales bacterium]